VVTIAIENLNVELGGRPVLHGIDATFESGALIGVIGPNGAGKSTLARAILGLIPKTSGSIRVDGRPTEDIAKSELARTIAYLPQGQTLHWPLTVERLVALGRLPHLGPLSRIEKADQDAVERAMERAEVGSLRTRIATELSGGERARALIARALAVEAPALIADEPLASLDPGHQLDVMNLLKAEARNGSLTIAVLHDLTMAARFCDRLLLVSEGRLVADDAPAAVLTPENLSRVYGVNAWIGEADGAPLLVPLQRNS
jgi:iron complex transport system ATP-binding protein